MTHPGIVEPETEERQLEVEILVNLRRRRVDVLLVVAPVFGTALVEVPVHELGADLRQALLRDAEGNAARIVMLGRCHPAF